MVDSSGFPESLSMSQLRDKIREDETKLQAIMQFLESRGLVRTLAQLETETELTYNPGYHCEGAVLDRVMDLLGRKENLEGNKSFPEKEVIAIPEPGVCASCKVLAINSIHGESNPTCVVWHPYERNVLATGGADRKVFFWSIQGNGTKLGELILPSPVLSMDWCSHQTGSIIAVGCMGGELLQFRIEAFDPFRFNNVSSVKPHGNARVTTLCFSENSTFLASIGKDFTLQIFGLEDNKFRPDATRTIRYTRELSSICWMDDETIIVAETENPILGIFNVSEVKPIRIGSICMNLSVNDPRTAYTTLSLSWSQEHRLLLSCTNRNSALLFSLPHIVAADDHICPVKTLYGMTIGTFDYPSSQFSLDGSHVYITSDREVLVFECVSGHRVFSLTSAGNKPIRCLRRGKLTDALACVSFDKTLSVFQ